MLEVTGRVTRILWWQKSKDTLEFEKYDKCQLNLLKHFNTFYVICLACKKTKGVDRLRRIVLKCTYASIATNISSRDLTIIQFFNFDWKLEKRPMIQINTLLIRQIGKITDQLSFPWTRMSKDVSIVYAKR